MNLAHVAARIAEMGTDDPSHLADDEQGDAPARALTAVLVA